MSEPARILIIEDNPTNLDLMVYLLNAFGYVALTAIDGECGVAAARSERPELVVCDVQLPKLDGYGVVAQLRDDPALQRLPIIAVTALAMVGDRSRILSAGFDGYISKPITPETFVHDIEKFLPAERRSQVDPSVTREQSEPVAVAKSSQENGLTILVVDDTPANIEFARSTLVPSGYKVFAATNVDDALAVSTQERPDLVLCDLHMLPQSGNDLLELAKIHPWLCQIPLVIISSTYTREGERLECLERGAAHFIKRPIEPRALLAEIADTFAKSKKR
jgi:two-component system cell cycle response regulator